MDVGCNLRAVFLELTHGFIHAAAVYRNGLHDKLRLSCGRRSHNSPNFLRKEMGDASVDATCDCVSRAKEWLNSVGCFDLSGQVITDVDVEPAGHDSFSNGAVIHSFVTFTVQGMKYYCFRSVQAQ